MIKKGKVTALIALVLISLMGIYSFKAIDKNEAPTNSGLDFNTISSPTAYEIGDVVADFSLRNIDEKMVSLANYGSAKGFIVIFTCNHCPFSKAYEDRMVALDAKYAPKGYPIIAINPNDPAAYEEDNLANMKRRAAEKGFTFPYLIDEKGVGQQFGATRTPHVFVLNKEGGKNIVKYIGAIDDNAQDSGGVSKRYVEDAVDNLLQNKPVVTQTTKAIGCSIKWR